MSDVRQQLRVVIQETAERRHSEREAASSTDFADAILERFDVVEKPVVTDEVLGSMACNAAGIGRFDVGSVGAAMHRQLWESGLRIVKVDAE